MAYNIPFARWGAMFVLLNALDTALTAWGITNGHGEVVEANPLMRLLIEQHVLLFVAVKMLVAVGIAWLCWRKRSSVIVWGTTLVGAFVLTNMALVTLMLLGK